jgi:DHA3 family macrolide efflux protein-like MFS transporter
MSSTTQRSMTPFLVLWSGQALSLIGSQAVQFALIWWLTRETGSATVLAAAAFVGLFPQVAFGPFIGVLVDRWSRKRVMFAADAVVALAAAALAWLFATGQATPTHVFALLFVRAVGGAFHAPAMTASTSLMVPEQHLVRIQGLNQLLQGGLSIVAAPLGAGLLAVFSMTGIMLVDVMTALPALLPLLAIHVPQPQRGGTGQGTALASMGRDMVDGFRYIARRHGHLTLLSMVAAINMCLVPAFSLLPLLVLEQWSGSAAQLAWLTSTLGVGMMAGGIALGVWGGFRRRSVTALTALIALGAAVVAMGLVPGSPFVLPLVAIFAVGLAAPAVNGSIQAIFQVTISPEYQGRLFSLMGSLAGAMAPVGLLLAAPVAEAIGVRAWYLAGGAMCAVMGVAGLLVPSVVGIESERIADDSTPEAGAEVA